MHRFLMCAAVMFLIAPAMIMTGCSEREATLGPSGQTDINLSKQNPDPGPGEVLPMNLSFPVIWAYPDSDTLLAPYINKVENITKIYTGSYPGVDDVQWLIDNGPWYPQPPYADENTWVADYLVSGDLHEIHFVDWGNPMENINPRVGQRFPVEVALFERIGYAEFDELGEVIGFVGTTMEGYKTACLEYDSTRDELFGTNKVIYASCFATVLTSEFTVTVRPPDTWEEYEIRLDPAVGPSGKMNFASANGGWIPTEPGWHRITLTINDPNISLAGAVVENDEHFDLLTGEQLEELSQNKKDLSGVVYNTTYIDVFVLPQSGGQKKILLP